MSIVHVDFQKEKNKEENENKKLNVRKLRKYIIKRK